MTRNNTRTDLGPVAVVGAGIAGLTVARMLANKGREVIVFEKARGVGGRTSRRRNEWGKFNHGTSSFGCATETFATQVQDWCDRKVIERWKEPICELSAGHVESVSEISPQYIGIPGTNAICRDLADTLEVEVGARIESIEGSPRKWNLRLEGGESFVGFGAVVVAAPAPQAAELLAHWPKLASPLSKVRMEPCHSLMLRFDSPLGLDFAAARVKGSPIALATRMREEGATGDGESWVLQSTPEWSAEHLEKSSRTVSQLLMEAFGRATARSLPRPIFDDVHLWRFARACEPLRQPYLWAPDFGLGTCGDWTHGIEVENAFNSGVFLGCRMLRCTHEQGRWVTGSVLESRQNAEICFI